MAVPDSKWLNWKTPVRPQMFGPKSIFYQKVQGLPVDPSSAATMAYIQSRSEPTHIMVKGYGTANYNADLNEPVKLNNGEPWSSYADGQPKHYLNRKDAPLVKEFVYPNEPGSCTGVTAAYQPFFQPWRQALYYGGTGGGANSDDYLNTFYPVGSSRQTSYLAAPNYLAWEKGAGALETSNTDRLGMLWSPTRGVFVETNQTGPSQGLVFTAAQWDLNSYNFPYGFGGYDANGRFQGSSGASASKIPICAIAVSSDEVKRGWIGHMMGMGWPSFDSNKGETAATRSHSIADPWWPARGTDGKDPSANSPVTGSVFRMKADVDISSLPEPYKVVCRAAKEYGIILMDTIGPVTFAELFTTTEPAWDDILPGQFDLGSFMTFDKFEIVNLTSRRADPRGTGSLTHRSI